MPRDSNPRQKKTSSTFQLSHFYNQTTLSEIQITCWGFTRFMPGAANTTAGGYQNIVKRKPKTFLRPSSENLIWLNREKDCDANDIQTMSSSTRLCSIPDVLPRRVLISSLIFWMTSHFNLFQILHSFIFPLSRRRLHCSSH